MFAITHVKPLENYRLELRFNDGVTGIVDVSHHVGRGVFAYWNDESNFRSVRIGEFGELVWGEDIDLCPDALYLEVTVHTRWALATARVGSGN